MQLALAGVNPDSGPDFVLVYMDDVLVFFKTLEDHLAHLCQVISRLKEAGLKHKPSKCKFVRSEVEYLGHIITPNGLKPNPRLVETVRVFVASTRVKEVRCFLGLASYYRQFVQQFARIAEPLHHVTKKDAKFQWSSECQLPLETLKKMLIEAPVS